MQDIILFGIQGSGKGTQCRNLMQEYANQITYFESGTILRALKSNDNPIGNYVKSIVDQGIYLPDEFLIGVFDLFMQVIQPNQMMLLDGFPRRLGQMHMYLERIQKQQRSIVGIYLELDTQIAINRLSIRRICPTCNSISSASESTPFPVCSKCQTPMIQRIDDTPEAIAKRIDQYFKETEPVLTYFRQHNWLVTIDANQKEQKVFEDITNVLKNI